MRNVRFVLVVWFHRALNYNILQGIQMWKTLAIFKEIFELVRTNS